jgi:ectoine hydroxylase
MTPEEVLSRPPTVLSEDQRAFYFDQGYLLLEGIVPDEWVERLRQVTDEVVEASRAVGQSDALEAPRLRRLSSPVAYHPAYWEYASQSIICDVMADLMGPDVKFHHSKLNFKWARGGEEVKWHQDIQFWPHTNYSPATVGTYIRDCGLDQGPLGVIAESHKGELFDEYNAAGDWVGCLSDADAATIEADKIKYLPGPAGSITIHNCRTIHGSKPNAADEGRPLLLNVYSAADAFPYTFNPLNSDFAGRIVRGQPARQAHHDPRPCQVPPDWSGGYTSIFALQQEENRSDTAT